MGRNKTIDDEALLDLIGKYYTEVCKGDAHKMKLPALAGYIADNGYPGYRVESLRRSAKARAYIESLKQTDEEKASRILVAYKTLDVDDLLDHNRTRASLKTALIALDAYYKEIAEGTIEISKKYQVLSKKYGEVQNKLEQTREQLSALTQEVTSLKQRIRTLESDKKVLRSIVEDYVYPDIANTLLANDGVLSDPETIIDADKLNTLLISGDTKISKEPEVRSGSTVLKELYIDFEGD